MAGIETYPLYLQTILENKKLLSEANSYLEKLMHSPGQISKWHKKFMPYWLHAKNESEQSYHQNI